MDFARRRDRPLFLIDDSKLAASFLQRVEKELLTLKNLTALFEASANGDLGRETAVEYQRAAHKIFHPGELPETWWPKDSDMAARETGLAQKLRLLHQGLLRRDGKTISGEELTAALLISPEAVGHMPESVYLDPDSVHLYLGGWETPGRNRGKRHPLFKAERPGTASPPLPRHQPPGLNTPVTDRFDII